MNPYLTWYHTIIAPPGQTLWAGSLWSNMFAWIFCGAIGFFVGKSFEKRSIIRNQILHEKLKEHISKEHEKSRKHLERQMGKE